MVTLRNHPRRRYAAFSLTAGSFCFVCCPALNDTWVRHCDHTNGVANAMAHAARPIAALVQHGGTGNRFSGTGWGPACGSALSRQWQSIWLTLTWAALAIDELVICPSAVHRSGVASTAVEHARSAQGSRAIGWRGLFREDIADGGVAVPARAHHRELYSWALAEAVCMPTNGSETLG